MKALQIQRILRRTLLGLAAALPLVPIAVGLILTSGSTAAGPTARGDALQPLSVPPASLPASLSPLPPGRGAVIAVLLRPTVMRSSPNGRIIARVAKRSAFGSPSVLWAPELRAGWLGVISTQAGNNRLGWISDQDVRLERIDWELRVSLAARQLTVLEGGAVVARYPVAIGRPSAPTPIGRFSVSDRLSTGDPSGPYGCCILALSARSPHAIQGWSGGDRIAIHSTPETSAIGQPVSHGCVRVTLAAGRWLLGHIPLGTPTLISSA